MAIQEKLYSADDLWELSHRPEYADMRLELSEGRLIVMPPAGWEHGGLTMWLGYVFNEFVTRNRLGMLTAAETGYIL
jgi:Uma2 family endonuclease